VKGNDYTGNGFVKRFLAQVAMKSNSVIGLKGG
jgi:hypothetical protein